MRYGSVCSGIEAASVAWHVLNWSPAFFSEIETFPKAVLAHRWPGVPDLGDFTEIGADRGPVDLLVGGTPCQSFSVAGLRGGMADARGNLALEFLRLAARLHARWVLWENVPGVLSSNGGRDLGALLGGLAELGYGFAYRVLDAQFFGVAQRRRRVFVVGHAGGLWQRAAAVLFERACLRGDPPPRRAKGTGSPGRAQERLDGSFAPVGIPDPAYAVTGGPSGGWRVGADEAAAGQLVPVAFHVTQDPISSSGATPALGCGNAQGCGTLGVATAMPFDWKQIGHPANFSSPKPGDPCHPMRGVANAEPAVLLPSMAIRRLTPRECERLQGFPDDYTAIPGAKDGPRYRALGNSMAVPVMAWIGRRIQMVEDALAAQEDAA